jgi:menaquinone-specific isochorismate synthase
VTDLQAVVVRVDRDVDPIAFAGEHGVVWARGGASLAGRGIATRIAIDDRADLGAAVSDTLSMIDLTSEVDVAAGPIAFGALPFNRHAPAALVVPELCAGRDRDGARWLCWIGTGAPPRRDELMARLAEVAPAPAPPTSFRIDAPRSPEDWCAAVAAARDDLRAGIARKVVLARDIRITCDRPILCGPVLLRLARSYPTCYLFSMPGLVGASPELLVSRHGDVVRSQPMAGTARRSPDPPVDARLAAGLLASQKDRVEHQITIDMVHDTLLPWCSYLDAETEPQVVSVANLHHLATAVEGRLSRPLPSVLDLVHALHPTPAVCGDPRDVAAALIARHEGMDRGCYAAPVGWVDRDGNGEWAVGVRSAELHGNTARLFAGVGVVADSDPAAELDETRVKLEAMLGAIVRP